MIRESIWWIGKVKCVVNSGIDECAPDADSSEWKLNTYWALVKAYRIYQITFYFYYIELFLYVTIGAIQVSSMGDLAITLSASMMELFPRDEHRLCTNLCQIKPKYHRMVAFLVSYIVIGVALAFAIDGFIFVHGLGSYKLIDSNGDLNLDEIHAERHTTWILIILWILSGLLLIYYILMR